MVDIGSNGKCSCKEGHEKRCSQMEKPSQHVWEQAAPLVQCLHWGLVPRPPLQKPPSRGLEGSGRGGDEGLKVEGGFTFGRLQGGLKGASRGLEGGFKGA